MILLDRLPVLPFMDPQLARLPGLAPLKPADWIHDLPDTAAQLALRDGLIRDRRAEVIDCLPGADEAASELLDVLLDHLATRDRWRVGAAETIVPGGLTVAHDRDDALATVGRLVPEDFCLMADPGDGGEYRLVAAVLCFPSHWLLSEKIGKPLMAIHEIVPKYGADLGRRVNRLFGMIRAGQPLYRVNWSLKATPELFLPARASDPARPLAEDGPIYLRSEIQTFVRLPRTGAVAFGIRTAIAPLTSLTGEEARAFATALDAMTEADRAYKDGTQVYRIARERLAGTWRPRQDSNL